MIYGLRSAEWALLQTKTVMYLKCFEYLVGKRSITVPTFNSCTESVGRLGIMHDRMPDCHPIFRVLMQ